MAPTNNNRDRLLAFEMKCYRRILGIKWALKISNEEERRIARCRKTVVQQIMGRRLNLFGHICRIKENRLVKEVMFVTMDYGWRDKERKTVLRMVGRHQGVGWRGNSHTLQEGTGSRHVENGGADSIGHLRAVSHGAMDGWSLPYLAADLCPATHVFPIPYFHMTATLHFGLRIAETHNALPYCDMT